MPSREGFHFGHRLRTGLRAAGVRGRLRRFGGAAARFLSQLLWRSVLDRETTIRLLGNAVVSRAQPGPIEIPALPPVDSTSAPPPRPFKHQVIRYDPDYVWSLRAGDRFRRLRITRSGTVLVDDRALLDLDFGATPGLVDLPFHVRSSSLPLVVAPWSHLWGTYYDFLVFVLAKLCRIEAAVGAESWQRVVLCYPRFNAPYEREYLQVLGVDDSRVVDTRPWGRSIEAHRMLVANNHDWYSPSPHDLERLRLRYRRPERGTQGRRIFLSRTNRRLIRNETGVRDVLRRFGFEVMPAGLSVEEQIELFRQSTYIVGPHGGAFANIVWCDPGTKVLEFFHHSYTPPYFYHLCRILDLEYSYMVDRLTPRGDLTPSAQDMTVDLRTLATVLERMVDG